MYGSTSYLIKSKTSLREEILIIVFLEVFGIPCLGCGITRALVSLDNGNIIEAIKYNVVIFFMPYVFTYVFFRFKSKIHNVLLVIIAIIAIINWLIKIILFL